MNERPYCIRLYVPSGDPTAVIVATRDNWNGRGVVFPRELLGDAKGRKEFRKPGVYMLVGNGKVYVGEGESVGDRLEYHANDSDKAFWTRAVFFVSEGDRLNKAHIQLIEGKLIALLKERGVYLVNSQAPGEPTLAEEDRPLADGFLRDVLLMLPLLGFHNLLSGENDETLDEEGGTSPAIGSGRGAIAARYNQLNRDKIYTLKFQEAEATLQPVEGGVSVKEGSSVVAEARASFEQGNAGAANKRRQLIESGVIENRVFTSDQFFTSASTAACVIRGQNSDADHWVDPDGENLGELLRNLREAAKSNDDSD